MPGHREDIPAKGPAHAFKYLGYHVRLDLGSGEATRSAIFTIRNVCSMIRSHELDLVQAADVLKEYLYPKLETALIYAGIPDARLDAWSGLIRRAVLHHGHDLSTRSIALPALFSALEVLPLREHACLLRSTEVGISLRCGWLVNAITAESRLYSARVAGRVEACMQNVAGVVMEVATHVALSRTVRCRLSEGLRAAQETGHTIVWTHRAPPPALSLPRRGVYRPELGCSLLEGAGLPGALPYYCVQDEYRGTGLVAFTDGSFAIADGEGATSGYAVVLCRLEDVLRPDFRPERRCVVLSGTAPVSGANYTAEVAAVLTALHAVPINVPLVLLSDAESVLKVLSRRMISVTAWLRLGARSLMGPLRRLVEERASLGFPLAHGHVRSHTGGTDAASLGNDLADRMADAARGCARTDVRAPVHVLAGPRGEARGSRLL
jgi:ribonuclease HI